MFLIDNMEEICSSKCTHILKQIKLTMSKFMQQPLSEYNRTVYWISILCCNCRLVIKFLVLKIMFVCLFVCLFVWGFSSHSRMFHSYGDVTITDEGLQILTYARHPRPLNSEGSEGSLACIAYCDTGH